MTHLHVMPENAPADVRLCTQSTERVTAELAAIGVRFERRTTIPPPMPDTADSQYIKESSQNDIDQLCMEGGYRFVDVAQLRSDPTKPKQAGTTRAVTLEDHFHTEEEVRFIVGGTACFYLHIDGLVYAVVCTLGDVIWVPAHTAHWFDVGQAPNFTAIRFFQNENGWVGHFLPDSIAYRFPTLDDLNTCA